MSSSNVRVVCRFRPINKREQLEASKKKLHGDNICVALEPDQNLISIKHLGDHSKKDALKFSLDKVLPTTTTQDECFQAVAEPAVRDILKGYNGTIFAYGQTGSGTLTIYSCFTFNLQSFITFNIEQTLCPCALSTRSVHKIKEKRTRCTVQRHLTPNKAELCPEHFRCCFNRSKITNL